jgi:hypothetical protein
MSAVANRDDEILTLRDGLAASVAALRLGWALEDRGLKLRVDGDDLVVAPKQLLTPADIEALRKYRADIVRILRFSWEPM